MKERIVTLTLVIGLFFGAIVLAMGATRWRLPGDQQGYAPEQPIAFSHRLHAGELEIDCQFCHVGAQRSRFAGVPTSDTCMKCHRFITAAFAAVMAQRKPTKTTNDTNDTADMARPAEAGTVVSDELRRLYDLIGADDKFLPRDEAGYRPIPWVRVHNLPDHVLFNHRAHVQVGIECQRCHGPVETFERMQQHASLSMGWCVNCHREVNETGVGGKPVDASIDCAACHY